MAEKIAELVLASGVSKALISVLVAVIVMFLGWLGYTVEATRHDSDVTREHVEGQLNTMSVHISNLEDESKSIVPEKQHIAEGHDIDGRFLQIEERQRRDEAIIDLGIFGVSAKHSEMEDKPKQKGD